MSLWLPYIHYAYIFIKKDWYDLQHMNIIFRKINLEMCIYIYLNWLLFKYLFRFAHLTNYSINKYSEDFVKNIDAADDFEGSKWSLTSLKDFLKSQGVPVE